MDLVARVRQGFFPEVYDQECKTPGPLQLCLLKKHGGARYCLAVAEFDPAADLASQIAAVRAAVRQATGALWMLKEVGAYLVLHADAADLNLHADQLEVDKTGVHAVIVQGIHLVGRDSAEVFKHSQWGGQTFGSADAIGARISDIVHSR